MFVTAPAPVQQFAPQPQSFAPQPQSFAPQPQSFAPPPQFAAPQPQYRPEPAPAATFDDNNGYDYKVPGRPFRK